MVYGPAVREDTCFGTGSSQVKTSDTKAFVVAELSTTTPLCRLTVGETSSPVLAGVPGPIELSVATEKLQVSPEAVRPLTTRVVFDVVTVAGVVPGVGSRRRHRSG